MKEAHEKQQQQQKKEKYPLTLFKQIKPTERAWKIDDLFFTRHAVKLKNFLLWGVLDAKTLQH